jgi:hypothetical protein
MWEDYLRIGTGKVFQPETPYPPNSFPNEIVKLTKSDVVLFRPQENQNGSYTSLDLIVKSKTDHIQSYPLPVEGVRLVSHPKHRSKFSTDRWKICRLL